MTMRRRDAKDPTWYAYVMKSYYRSPLLEAALCQFHVVNQKQ